MRRQPRRGGGSAFGPERLEHRHFLAADLIGPTATPADDPGCGCGSNFGVGYIAWQDQEVFAIRDSYIVGFGDSPAADPLSTLGQSEIQAGWSLRPLPAGLFQLSSPGASTADVMAWSGRVNAAVTPEAALEKASALLPDDEFYNTLQWGLNNTGAPNPPEGPEFRRTADSDIDMPEAWNYNEASPFVGDKSIIVAVFDDGIDYRHPDLQENIWKRYEQPQTGTVNGVVRNIADFTDEFGVDTSNDPNALSAADRVAAGPEGSSTLPWRYGSTIGINNSHGTHTAGIIGAVGGNREGIAGVNWAVSLYSAKIFRYDGTYGGSGAFLEAVNRIVTLKQSFNQNFVVANAGFYSYGTADLAMRTAVELLSANDILLVAASGNGRHRPCTGAPTDGVGDKTTDPEQCVDQPVWPANITPALFPTNPGLPMNVLSVASSTARDTLSRFSNWGPDVHIAAPGENIWSTVPRSATVGGRYWMHEPWNSPGDYQTRYRLPNRTPMRPGDIDQIIGGYASMSGTSMSAAYVSGVAAIVAGHYRMLTDSLPSVTFLRNAILNGADQISSLTYTERSGTPAAGQVDYHPDDMFANQFGNNGTIVDPYPTRVHSIQGDRRLNAYGSIDWAYNNLPPQLSVRQQPSDDTEGDPGGPPQFVTFDVALDKGSPTPITVFYWTEDIQGQAVGGVDYVAIPETTPQQFTIPAGTLSTTFRIATIPDLIPESNESFRVRMRVAAGDNAFFRNNFAIGLIYDDDGTAARPAFTLETPAITVVEGNGGRSGPTIAFVPVTISPATSRVAQLSFRVSELPAGDPNFATRARNGQDFVGRTGTITILPGQTTAQIPVRIIGDTRPVDGASEFALEPFVVHLVSANQGVFKGWLRTTRVTIQDDDGPAPPGPPTPGGQQVRIAALTPQVAEGQAASFRITAAAAVAPGWVMTVFYRTVNGTAVGGRDFASVTSGRVVIRSGATTADLQVRTLLDRESEPLENFSVSIMNVQYRQLGSVSPGEAVTVVVRQASVSIQDVPAVTTSTLAMETQALLASGLASEETAKQTG